MAITTPRRRQKDPEGRMPLRAHLQELRSRLLKAALAIGLGAVIGWFVYDPTWAALQRPILDFHGPHGTLRTLAFAGVSDPFNLKLKLSVYLGLVLASPVWLYQLWAFVVPGLTRREKRYAVGYVAFAVPLFLSGIWVAWLVLPNAIHFFFGLTPTGVANIIDATAYLTFVTKLMLAFGVAFVLPEFLVALNMLGLITGLALARSWRIAVFLVFLFAALASPTPDAGSMLALAFPMVGLYLAAVGISLLNDRRRAARRLADGFGDLPDDQASPLDERPEPVDETDLR